MGDRGNIFVVQHPPGAPQGGIYIYGHWEGSRMLEHAQRTLQNYRERWDDEPYLTRLLASQVVGKRWESETGFGLSTYLTDNEHSIVVVDAEAKTVGLAKPGQEPITFKSWTFREFVEADLSDEPEDT